MPNNYNVGILTFHDGINFGAFLQAFALQECIESLGYEVKIINYKSDRHFFWEMMSLFFTKNPSIFIRNFLKLTKFKKAHNLLKITNKIRAHTQIKELNLSVIVVGSDEVWNFKNSVFGFDGLYYGIGIEEYKLVSYAGCFGKITELDEFPYGVAKGLSSFNYLSARDKNTKSILKSTISRSCEIVLDPTFLIDFEGYVVKPNLSGYIVYYGLDLPEKSKIELIEYAKSNKKRIISIGYYHSFADECYVSIDPFEWLGFIKYADKVVTNMFHGTVFSIIFEKNFVSIATPERKNKLLFLLDQFLLTDRYIDETNALLCPMLDKDIKYDVVNHIKRSEIRKSISYIDNSLS